MPSYLVYQILKKYSNKENPLKRSEIREKLSSDYKIDVKSDDTITKDLKEIGYINWGELEKLVKNKDDVLETIPSVIKNGNKGFFVLADENLNLGETTFLLSSIMSNFSLHKDDVSDIKTKVVRISNSPRNYFNLGKLNQINASIRMNTSHEVLENLTIVAKALAKKKDIEFTHKLEISNNIAGADLVKIKQEKRRFVQNLTMAPYYISYRGGKIIVIGSMYNINFKEDLYESKANKKYILYAANLENMTNIQILSDEEQTPLKIYDDFNQSVFLHSRLPIFEGELDLNEAKRIGRYKIAFQNKKDFRDLYNFFGLNVKEVKQNRNGYEASIETFDKDIIIFIVSVRDFIKRYQIEEDKLGSSSTHGLDVHSLGFLDATKILTNDVFFHQLLETANRIARVIKAIRNLED